MTLRLNRTTLKTWKDSLDRRTIGVENQGWIEWPLIEWQLRPSRLTEWHLGLRLNEEDILVFGKMIARCCGGRSAITRSRNSFSYRNESCRTPGLARLERPTLTKGNHAKMTIFEQKTNHQLPHHIFCALRSLAQKLQSSDIYWYEGILRSMSLGDFQM